MNLEEVKKDLEKYLIEPYTQEKNNFNSNVKFFNSKFASKIFLKN